MFCFQASFAHLRANKTRTKTNFGYSIVKHLKNAKERQHQSFSRELRVTAPKTNSSLFSKTLKFFMLWEREPSRSRFIKSFCRDGLNRPVSADIPYYQNWRSNGRIDSSRTASHKLRALRSLVCLYVSNSESRKLSPKIFASCVKQLKFLARLKIACQDFFVKIFRTIKFFSKMSEPFWM
jgi:hypothetical protein